VRSRQAAYDVAAALQLEVNELEVQQRIPEAAKSVMCALAATSQLLVHFVAAHRRDAPRDHPAHLPRLARLVCLGLRRLGGGHRRRRRQRRGFPVLPPGAVVRKVGTIIVAAALL
jgi:hypothetical protein